MADNGGVPTAGSSNELLTLHAVRLLGYADAPAIARRFGLDPPTTRELLLDFQAAGWVTWAAFAGAGGWALTDAGRCADERQLAAELAECGAADMVSEVRDAFEPLNTRFLAAVTRWQVRPLPGDPLAANDHRDHRWDDRVVADLGSLGSQMAPLARRLASALDRFGGYDTRYRTAWEQVSRGAVRWVDALGVDSCHVVWFQLHEDLMATLGIQRGGSGGQAPS